MHIAELIKRFQNRVEQIRFAEIWKIRRNDIFNSVTSALYFVFLFFSSMFYPLGPLPAALRRVAYANPLTWEIDLLRYGSIGLGEPRQLAIEGLGFTVFVLACFAYAVHSLNHE